MKNKFLTSRYPIICAPMNGVYSYQFISSCSRAGITPGVFYNQIPKKDLEQYCSEHSDVGIVVSLSANELMNDSIIESCVQDAVIGVEIVDLVNPVVNSNKEFITRFKNLKQSGKINFIFKQFKGNRYFSTDIVCLMGSGKAGRTPRVYTSIEEQHAEWSLKEPELKFLVSGGIHKAEQVKYFIDREVLGVVIGTLFAASEESPISYQAKLKMVEATAANIHMFTDTKQNALVFSDQDETEPYHSNHTESLIDGITTGTSGHLFAGTGLDSIHSIRPIKEIVADLVKLL